MSFIPELLEQIPFDEHDKLALQRAIAARWKTRLKWVRITLLIPLFIAAILAGIFYLLEYRYTIFNIERPNLPFYEPNPWTPIFFVTPAMFLVSLANIIMFFKTIPSIYVDKFRGMKTRILFIPEPYMIPDPIQTEEMNKYYIKTNVHEFPYFEVDFRGFIAAGSVEYLVLELTPITRVLLGIRTKDNENILTF